MWGYIPVEWGLFAVPHQRYLNPEGQNRSGGDSIKQGIEKMWIDGCRLSNSNLQWQK